MINSYFSFFQGCGEGECMTLVSGFAYCHCFDDAIKNKDGSCSPNPGFSISSALWLDDFIAYDSYERVVSFDQFSVQSLYP